MEIKSDEKKREESRLFRKCVSSNISNNQSRGKISQNITGLSENIKKEVELRSVNQKANDKREI